MIQTDYPMMLMVAIVGSPISDTNIRRRLHRHPAGDRRYPVLTTFYTNSFLMVSIFDERILP
jgi:hypothetical protein